MRRRAVIAGTGAAAAGLAAVGLWRFTGLFRRYAPTPYDDLVAQLDDRDRAALLGKHAVGMADARMTAQELRTRIGNGSLAKAASDDVQAGRMSEVDGWVLPRSVAQMAALAAHA
jgi:hypothetical protein